jgi:hypothetical protein
VRACGRWSTSPAPQGPEDDGEKPAETVAGGGRLDAVMLRQAAELIVDSQFGSTSMLQRKLRRRLREGRRVLMDELERSASSAPSPGLYKRPRRPHHQPRSSRATSTQSYTTRVTALGAVEHLRGNDGRALAELDDKIRRVHARAMGGGL